MTFHVNAKKLSSQQGRGSTFHIDLAGQVANATFGKTQKRKRDKNNDY